LGKAKRTELTIKKYLGQLTDFDDIFKEFRTEFRWGWRGLTEWATKFFMALL